MTKRLELTNYDKAYILDMLDITIEENTVFKVYSNNTVYLDSGYTLNLLTHDDTRLTVSLRYKGKVLTTNTMDLDYLSFIQGTVDTFKLPLWHRVKRLLGMGY